MLDNLFTVISDSIIDPIILLLFVLGLAYFLWGVFAFIRDAGEKDREEGKKHMLWGVIGMFIMASVKGIIAIIEGTFGI